MAELKSLTLNGVKYDSFVDLTARSGSDETGVEIIEHPFSEDGFFTTYGNIYHYEGEPSTNTGYIPLDGIHTIEYKAYLSDIGYELAFYDSNKNFLRDISILGRTSWETHTVDITEEKYSNAAYVMASNYGNSSTLLRTTKGYKESTAGNQNIGTKGKTILIFGDSLTETDYMDDDCSNYIKNGW